MNKHVWAAGPSQNLLLTGLMFICHIRIAYAVNEVALFQGVWSINGHVCKDSKLVYRPAERNQESLCKLELAALLAET